eukprot:maker-scaffold334_size202906-snap-gene-1.30 protein:Tk08978 transcript:maker-scaffold334_size202906-snap-gene-1.30-mRNA-1 annotation:"sulfotransferase family"
MVTPRLRRSSSWIGLKDQKLTTKTTLVQKLPNILVIMLKVRLNGRLHPGFHLIAGHFRIVNHQWSKGFLGHSGFLLIRNQKPNYEGFIVIGAGLPRTGTSSLRDALSILLDGACYHMFNVATGSEKDFHFWTKALEKGTEIPDDDWKEFLEGRGYRAGVDAPLCFYYKQLIKAFPNAKVVLTVRSPESWFHSVTNSILASTQIIQQWPCQLYLRLWGRKKFSDLVYELDDRLPIAVNGFPKGLWDVIESGETESVAFFNQWTDYVVENVPKERLLIMEVKEGWNPLCKFLDVPVPKEPFPSKNETAVIRKNINHKLLQEKGAMYDGRQKKNFDGFVVIGAGLPRTGTTTMKSALGTLLNGLVYHMVSVIDGPPAETDFWFRAIAGEVSQSDWQNFLEKRGYRGGVDYPISLFFRELMEVYPNAKVILTVRDPKRWRHSVLETVYQMWTTMPSYFATRTFFSMMGRGSMMGMIFNLASHVSEGMTTSLHEAVEAGDDEAVKFFNEWTGLVKKSVPAEKLLVFEVKQGWGPLCQFLDLPVPDIPFPRLNDSAEMQRKRKVLIVVSHLAIYGGPVLLGVMHFQKGRKLVLTFLTASRISGHGVASFSGSLGQGSPKRVFKVMAAPSAWELMKYPPSIKATVFPPAKELHKCIKWEKVTGETFCSPSGQPRAGSNPADIRTNSGSNSMAKGKRTWRNTAM